MNKGVQQDKLSSASVHEEINRGTPQHKTISISCGYMYITFCQFPDHIYSEALAYMRNIINQRCRKRDLTKQTKKKLPSSYHFFPQGPSDSSVMDLLLVINTRLLSLPRLILISARGLNFRHSRGFPQRSISIYRF